MDYFLFLIVMSPQQKKNSNVGMLRGSWLMLQLALIAYHAHRPELCLNCNGSGQSEIVSFQTDFYLNQ